MSDQRTLYRERTPWPEWVRAFLIHMGSTRLVRRVVPYADIVSMEPVVYRPIREFGGWGIRGFGKKRAWTASGNRALVLNLTGGRQLYVGSPHPQRLEERIRTAAGEGKAGE